MINYKPMRALIYLRVSTDKQAEKGIAIPTQKEKCLDCLKTHVYEFDETTDLYTDRGESARTMDRPALLDMINRCETDKSVGAIIVYDLSRLARDRMDFAVIKQMLNKRNIKFISATETAIDESPEGQFLEGMLSTVAEFSSTQNARRVKLNMAKKAKDGIWPTRAPFGYQNVQEKISTGKVHAWIEVDENRKHWVERAFMLYATGQYGIRQLAIKLQEEGFPIKQGKQLQPSFVENMLKNKFYIGSYDWPRKKPRFTVENAQHPPIISRDIFETVQSVIQAHNLGADRKRKHHFLLRGLAACGECGSRWTAGYHKSRNGQYYGLYSCPKKIGINRTICTQGAIDIGELELQFEKLIKLAQLPEHIVGKVRYKLKKIFEKDETMYEEIRKSLITRIENNRQKKRALLHKNLDGKIDDDTYDQENALFLVEEKSLNDQLEKVEMSIAKMVRTIEMSLALANNCYRAYKKAPYELRALIAHAFFQNLVIKDKQIIQATLNAPLDYLCAKRLQDYPVFQLASICGRGRSRTFFKDL